jgi:NAD(P)-dependent dehydrogenase (short-subunit alcohol dehydrogenase family)
MASWRFALASASFRSLTMSAAGLALASASRPAVAEPAHKPKGVAIVTGGGRGIGAACSRGLAARGYSVVIAYRSDADAAAAVCKEIQLAGGVAQAVCADVAEERDVRALFEAADAQGPLTVLVNNAGVLGPRGPLSEVGTADQLNGVMATNVVGAMLCCREAEKRMSTKSGGGGGCIVQVSSGSAYIGSPLLYAASKGALNSLTIGLVKPFGEEGIRINTVSPGMTATDMVAETSKTFDYGQIPLGRIGEPDEIANAVCWLCSDEASFVAGANIRVAGGRPPGTTLG